MKAICSDINNKTEIARELIEKGKANPKLGDNRGMTAVDFAIRSNRERRDRELIQVLGIPEKDETLQMVFGVFFSIFQGVRKQRGRRKA
jgi:ankyrin repeat protein